MLFSRMSVLVTVILSVSCQKSLKSLKGEEQGERVVRAYKVPPLYGNQVDQALGRILGAKVTTTYLSKGESGSGEEVSRVEPEIGRATLASPDVLAVSAPLSIQDGIPDFIETLVEAKADSLGQIDVDLYSIVEIVGVKAEKIAIKPDLLNLLASRYPVDSKEGSPSPAKCLVEVEHLFSRSMNGVRIKSRGNYLSLNAKILPLEGRFIGDIEVRNSRGLSGDFETRVSLQDGVFTKVSESSTEMFRMPENILRNCQVNQSGAALRNTDLSAKIIFALRMSSVDMQK